MTTGTPLDRPLARLVRATSGLMTVRLVGVAAQYGLNIALARTLPVDDVAAYWFWTTVVGLSQYIAGLGYASGAIRFLPGYFENKDYAGVRGFALQSVVAAVVGTLVLGAIGLTAFHFFVPESPLFRFDLAIAATTLLLPSCLLQIGSSVTRATHRAVKALLIPSLGQPLILLVGFLSINSVYKLTAPELLWLGVAAAVAACALQGWIVKRLPEFHSSSSVVARYETSEWLYRSVSLGLFTLIWNFSQSVDFLLVGTWLPADQVGLYGAALKIFAAQQLLASTLTVSASSHLAAKLATRENGLRTEVATLTLLLALAMIGSFALFLICGPDFLNLLGYQFRASQHVLVILSFGLVIRSLFGPCEVLLAYGNAERDLIVTSVAAIALTVAGAKLVAPTDGTAIAVVSTCAFLLTWIGAYIRTRRILGFDPSIVGSLRTILRRSY